MRKLILFLHTSLDGYVARLNGDISWVKIDDEMFDVVARLTDQADTALHGRVTFQLMESYWPTAAEQPNATKHDIYHSRWYNKVLKVVISRTINEAGLTRTLIFNDNITENIRKLKKEKGKNIIIFGSPSTSHYLVSQGLVDEFWLLINPILLGQGIPCFKGLTENISLSLIGNKTYSNGVIELHYSKV